MRKGSSSLPLAFVLAMAADASAAGLPDATQPDQPLKAGDLRRLLDRAVDQGLITRPMDQPGDRRLPGDKTAQYFPNFPNFSNCISGTWRNC